MKEIKIFLDDERDPTNPIIQKKFGAEGDEIWIKRGEEVISLLKRKDIKVVSISLDHDLGYISQMTGYDVANEIERMCYDDEIRCPSWRVHSSNPVGARRIEIAMRNAERYSNEKTI